MALSVLTRGFKFGSVNLVVTRGYTAGAAIIPPPPAPGDGGGVKRRHEITWLTEAEKRKAKELVAKIEAELQNLAALQESEKSSKASIAKSEQKIERYQTELVKLDPTFSAMVETLLDMLKARQKLERLKARRRREEEIAIALLLEDE